MDARITVIFLFWTGDTLILGKFGPKNQNCQFDLSYKDGCV